MFSFQEHSAGIVEEVPGSAIKRRRDRDLLGRIHNKTRCKYPEIASDGSDMVATEHVGCFVVSSNGGTRGDLSYSDRGAILVLRNLYRFHCVAQEEGFISTLFLLLACRVDDPKCRFVSPGPAFAETEKRSEEKYSTPFFCLMSSVKVVALHGIERAFRTIGITN